MLYNCENLAITSHFHVSFLVGFIYECNKSLSFYTARFSDTLAHLPPDAESLWGSNSEDCSQDPIILVNTEDSEELRFVSVFTVLGVNFRN